MKTTLMFGLRTIACAALTSAVLLFAVGSSADAQNWIGGGPDNEFSTAANWSDGTTPDPMNAAQNIDGVFTVERSVDSATSRTFLNNGAVLNMTGGAHSDARAGANIFNFVGSNGTCTFNQSGGSFDIGHGLRIGTGGNPNGDGTYNLTGGDLIISRGSNSALDPDPAGGRPSLEVGSVIGVGGIGLFEMSGSSTLETRGPAHLLGTGVISVVGSSIGQIGIGLNGSGDGGWLQQTGAILRAGLDAGGLTPIFIDEVDGDPLLGNNGDVTFEPGSILDPYDAGGANNAWTAVMTWEGTLTGGSVPTLSATSVAAGWEMRVEGNELQVRNPSFGPPVAAPAGDFNGDGIVDCSDLDGYVGNIGAAATGALAELDIDGDGSLSIADADMHISTLVVTQPNGVTGTVRGDLNCDGQVSVLGDAFLLVGSLNGPATTYAQGDVNFDETVTVLGDAFVLVGALGTSNDP